MKLRLTSNSVRFRISPTELKTLRETGKLESCTAFGPEADKRLAFVLLGCAEASTLRLDFAGTSIRVTIPDCAIARWTDSDEVGMEGTQAVADGQELKISIEKDFHCLESRAEDGADRFSNPAACRP